MKKLLKMGLGDRPLAFRPKVEVEVVDGGSSRHERIGFVRSFFSWR